MPRPATASARCSSIAGPSSLPKRPHEQGRKRRPCCAASLKRSPTTATRANIGGCNRSPISPRSPTTRKAGATTTAACKAHRSTPIGQTDLLRCARQLGRRQKRRRALALGAGDDGRLEPEVARRRAASRGPRSCSRSSTCRRWPASRFRCSASPTDDAEDSAAHLGARHARRRRNDRPPRHRHPALQAARRPELHQALSASARAAAAAGRARRSRTALTELGTIFENRRQFDRAAEYWRLAIERFTGDERKQYQNRLDQIIGNWGEFGSSLTQPAGRGATIDFRFRNAKDVEFTAQPIDVAKLLADVQHLSRTRSPNSSTATN